MPLARLENFLKNLNGNTLYVDPNELDSTDSIENRGNSRLRPFKTIQRALLEAARFAYVGGSNNDLFDQTTIMIAPGTHYIDNRPGYYVDASNNIKDINNSSKSISEFNILSNFDLTDAGNQLYIYNSVDGGVILPKGTSLVASDLRKTKIRPLFVPDPTNGSIANSSVFRLTGSCYFFGFTIYDGDPLGSVYNTYSTTKVTPSYSHHKLTAFEYADGINKVTRNSSNTGHTDLEMYYYKLALGFGQQSGRSVIDGYLNFQPNIDEYRIVGDLGAGEVGISSVRSGNGVSGTNVITVTTSADHGLSTLTPIIISGVGSVEGSPTTTEYNGNFIVAQITSPTQFTYLTASVPSATLNPSSSGATVKVISDTVSSSSPYVFNCSLKSVYGMNGLHADGSKATGFRSMVTAQFTGISLQKDDRAFVRYDSTSGTYLDQTSFGVTKFLHQDTDSIYQPDWSSFHIKASNDAFIQCVSIFAIGYSNQFVANDGGDQSITNSNSNFGERALFSEGFKKDAFPKDDYGFVTHIIPPKDVSISDQNINTYVINKNLPNSNTKIYLDGYSDVLNPPAPKVRGYAIGGRQNDKLYYSSSGTEYYADITPNYQINTNITTINTSTNQLTLASVSGISTGLPIKIVSKNALLPDGIDNNQTYFAQYVSGTNIRIYKNLTNCNSDTGGSLAVDIQNTVGLSTSNLYVVSRLSDLNAGDVRSPIQWDSTNNNWYIGITTNVGSPTFSSNLSSLTNSPNAYLKRSIDTRTSKDKSYRVRYVVPKDSVDAAVPSSGFIFQKSGRALNSTYSQASSTGLSPSTDILSTVRNTNVIVDAWYTSGTVTVVTKKPHNLKVGNKISIYNLKSSNEPAPIGIGTGTGFNGNFVVAGVTDDLIFTYTSSVNPGTITAGISTTANWLTVRDCAQTSSFRIPPYTIYDTNRSNLPYFTCDQIQNHYQTYDVEEIQSYTSGSSDGIYHITLDNFKNIPTVSPFSASDYKLGQSLDNIYPKIDFDNVTVDPDSSTTVASRKTIGMVEINDPYLSSTKESIIEYFKDFDLGKKISQITKSGSNVIVTTSVNHGISGITSVTNGTLGSGYTNGDYYDIPLCGGTGSNATVNVTVSGGTPSSFEIANPGSGYSVGDILTVKGIPGSTNSTTVSIANTAGLNFNPTSPNIIQVLGATNSSNNGTFAIASVTSNTITYGNTSGVTESTTNAVLVMSGNTYPIQSSPDGSVYNSTTGITTITTSSTYPHSLSVGNKVAFNVSGLGICTITSVIGNNSFTVKGDAGSATKVYTIGLIPTLADTNATNENLNLREFVPYTGYTTRLSQDITSFATTFSVDSIQGFKKGDFIQIDSETMLITQISGGTLTVTRGVLGTLATLHLIYKLVKTVSVVPVELRRPSILRASGHTFEYTGFGPGNYSTAMPTNQTKVLNDTEIGISQALPNRGGSVLYTGMNSKGEYFIGKKKFNASTGEVIPTGGSSTIVSETSTSNFNTLTVNKLFVNETLDASTASVKASTLSVESVLDSTSTDTGALVIEGGVGIEKNLNVGGTLNITGVSTFSNRIVPSPGNVLASNGIVWKADPGGGLGDVAFIQYYVESGENTRLHIGIRNDADDDIYLEATQTTTSGNLNVGAGLSVTGIATATTFIGAGTIPIGGIIMWSGTIANIPTGWALCNGSNATPDLRNRFIVGAYSDGAGGAGPGFNADNGTLNNNYTPGNTGGETAHQLTIPELASHTHLLNGTPNLEVPQSSAPGMVVQANITQAAGAGRIHTIIQGGSQIVDTKGEDKYHENRPPYYALAFIMRTL